MHLRKRIEGLVGTNIRRLQNRHDFHQLVAFDAADHDNRISKWPIVGAGSSSAI